MRYDSLKSEFYWALKESDIFWKRWYEEEEAGYYINEFVIDGQSWDIDIRKIDRLCAKYGASYTKNEKYNEVTIRLKL